MMCGSPHGKMTSKVFGGVLIIVGILWWFTNYGLWILCFDWLLPCSCDPSWVVEDRHEFLRLRKV